MSSSRVDFEWKTVKEWPESEGACIDNSNVPLSRWSIVSIERSIAMLENELKERDSSFKTTQEKPLKEQPRPTGRDLSDFER